MPLESWKKHRKLYCYSFGLSWGGLFLQTLSSEIIEFRILRFRRYLLSKVTYIQLLHWFAFITVRLTSVTKFSLHNCKLSCKIASFQVFLRCFRDPTRVPRIENRVRRIRENYQRKYPRNLVWKFSGPYRPIPGTCHFPLKKPEFLL